MSVNKVSWDGALACLLGGAALLLCSSYAVAKSANSYIRVSGVIKKSIETFSVNFENGQCVSLVANSRVSKALKLHIGKRSVVIGKKIQVNEIYDGTSEYRTFYKGKEIVNNCQANYVIVVRSAHLTN